jgi:hypothetical protein
MAPPSSDNAPCVASSLVKNVWKFYLEDYPDPSFVKSILHIIDHGASLGFIGLEHPQSCRNLKSASEAPGTVSSAIDALLAKNAAHGPFNHPPFPTFRASPLGTAVRKRSLKRRLINHLSWPAGDSVNNGIPDAEGKICYESFESALQLVRSFGKGTLLAKLDLQDAFRHIPVRPQDWPLLGFHWQSRFYYAVVLMFGIKSAPYIFNLFAEALHWIIKRHIPGDLRHYLDDFLPAFPPGTPISTANMAVQWCKSLGSQLGFQFQDSKTVNPCTELEFVGLEIDTIAMEARLPQDKLAFLRETLDDWLSKKAVHLRELQALIGFLQFASQVIPHSQAFIRRLINFSMTFQSPFSTRHIPAYAFADVVWWRSFAFAWNGVRLISPSYPTLHVYTDASGTKGIGGIHGSSWFSSRVPRRFRTRDIQFKEIYAVLQAILRWGHLWKHHHIIFHIDNEAIVDAMTKHTNRSRFTMSILRPIVMLAAFLEFSFSSSWLSSISNALADAASRFQYARLFKLAPYLEQKSCSTNPQLSGIKRTLTSRPPSRSFSGMDSPLAQERRTAPDSALTSTSSHCTPTFSIPTAPSSRPTKLRSWNGLRISDTQKRFLHRRSKPTSATSSHSTRILTLPVRQLSPQLPNDSFAASSATSVTVQEGPLPQSHLMSFGSSSSYHSQTLRSTQQTSTQPSSLLFQVSCAQGNSQ